MTTRAYAFPRIDVREGPSRSADTLSTWRRDWDSAMARARGIKALPSVYALPVRAPRTAEAPASLVEQRRRNGVFET